MVEVEIWCFVDCGLYVECVGEYFCCDWYGLVFFGLWFVVVGVVDYVVGSCLGGVFGVWINWIDGCVVGLEWIFLEMECKVVDIFVVGCVEVELNIIWFWYVEEIDIFGKGVGVGVIILCC